MRVHAQADGAMTVFYGLTDCDEFNRGWPCSTVKGRGSWVFDKDGNLVDATGSASKGAGEEWVAFSRDCQVWGWRRRLPGSTINDADKAVRITRYGNPEERVAQLLELRESWEAK